jgi:hypothetical protein
MSVRLLETINMKMVKYVRHEDGLRLESSVITDKWMLRRQSQEAPYQRGANQIMGAG